MPNKIMTWGEFKARVEKLGVQDNFSISSIDVDGLLDSEDIDVYEDADLGANTIQN